MKYINRYIILGFLAVVLFSSCKSEFERVRASGDPKLIQEQAYKYYEEEEYEKAQILFELIISVLKGQVEAEDVYFKYAYTQYYLQKYVLAAYYFKSFTTTFSTSQHREEADFMSAFSNYKLSPTYRLDQKYSLEAIDGFQNFVNTYPQSDKVPECNKLIDQMRKKLEQKAYTEGELYFNMKQYQAAMHSFENLLKDFPESADSEKVRYLMAKAAYLLAENSIIAKQGERYEKAAKYADKFITRYDKSTYTSEVRSISINSQENIKKLRNEGYKNQSAGLRS